ncbi:helix-turn-helix transcriptional regulator [Nocardiopsis sp. CNT312]|uniref:helix-turn-helix domain-containing protein n=1 Tax=Nocardiopsis sp. CNT312 TaxID=1137268 RepID=UPI001E4F230E|nr:helix-turn-helix transcriptional regulator [Nocardiopsis sp. CNT312]
MSGNPDALIGSRHKHQADMEEADVTASPPLSKRRLSRMLRESREATGLTADQVTEKARELGATKWSASKITRLERDEWVRPKLEDVELLLDVYGVHTLDEREEYVRLAKEARQKSWWRSYDDVIEGKLTGLEPGASRIRDVALTVIPGLLQTQVYARAVIIGGGIVDTQEIDRRVEARMLRQRILDPQADGPKYWAIIDEAALRKIPTETREQQLRHLISIQRSDLRIQILPDSAGLHAAVAGGFTILDFAEDSGLVYTENAVRERVHDDGEDTEAFDLVYQHVSASALGVQESTAFLKRLID